MKNIIFDLDNTLLFINNDLDKVYYDFIKKYNLEITSSYLYRSIGDFDRNTKDMIVTKEIMINYLKNEFNINLTLKMFDDLLERYANIELINIDIVRDILEYLSKKYNIIAYTNWFTDNQIKRLKRYDLLKYFSEIYGWDLINKKPSKNGLLQIIDDIDPSSVIFIGDSIPIDMEVPKSLDIRCIFVNNKKVEQNIYEEVFDLLELKEHL